MTLEGEPFELEPIAKAFQAIAKEISYRGLAQALLEAALENSGAVKGAVLLSEGSELLAKADASFSREMATVIVSRPPVGEFRLPADLSERVLTRQETVVNRVSCRDLASFELAKSAGAREVSLLCLPLIHQHQTIGALYLESDNEEETFTPRCVSVMMMLASQAAVAFESAQLFEALRETNMWMIKGQQIGRMGSYRWNTRTALSRASRECYRIFDIDLDVNPVPFEVFGSRVHPDDLPALEEHLAAVVGTRSPFSHEYRIVHRDGTILHVVAVGQFDVSPSGDVELEGIITDVTEQKAAEQALAKARTELVKAARLASLGELAGSIVHEVNQPLTGIVASAEACLQWLGRDPPEAAEARKSATRVVELSLRASKVVSGLRSLVRETGLEFAPVNFNDAIAEVLILMKAELARADVTLRTDFDSKISKIEADRVQLQQVVLNLVRNAVEAMGNVRAKARVLTASSRMIDGQAAVTIADTGPGIEPEVAERLFDTLYTTKSNGLGLGLSICRKIIIAHGGRLWVDRSNASGTAFTFAVPLRHSAGPAENS